MDRNQFIAAIMDEANLLFGNNAGMELYEIWDNISSSDQRSLIEDLLTRLEQAVPLNDITADILNDNSQLRPFEPNVRNIIFDLNEKREGMIERAGTLDGDSLANIMLGEPDIPYNDPVPRSVSSRVAEQRAAELESPEARQRAAELEAESLKRRAKKYGSSNVIVADFNKTYKPLLESLLEIDYFKESLEKYLSLEQSDYPGLTIDNLLDREYRGLLVGVLEDMGINTQLYINNKRRIHPNPEVTGSAKFKPLFEGPNNEGFISFDLYKYINVSDANHNQPIEVYEKLKEFSKSHKIPVVASVDRDVSSMHSLRLLGERRQIADGVEPILERSIDAINYITENTEKNAAWKAADNSIKASEESLTLLRDETNPETKEKKEAGTLDSEIEDLEQSIEKQKRIKTLEDDISHIKEHDTSSFKQDSVKDFNANAEQNGRRTLRRGDAQQTVVSFGDIDLDTLETALLEVMDNQFNEVESLFSSGLDGNTIKVGNKSMPVGGLSILERYLEEMFAGHMHHPVGPHHNIFGEGAGYHTAILNSLMEKIIENNPLGTTQTITLGGEDNLLSSMSFKDRRLRESKGISTNEVLDLFDTVNHDGLPDKEYYKELRKRLDIAMEKGIKVSETKEEIDYFFSDLIQSFDNTYTAEIIYIKGEPRIIGIVTNNVGTISQTSELNAGFTNYDSGQTYGYKRPMYMYDKLNHNYKSNLIKFRKLKKAGLDFIFGGAIKNLLLPWADKLRYIMKNGPSYTSVALAYTRFGFQNEDKKHLYELGNRPDYDYYQVRIPLPEEYTNSRSRYLKPIKEIEETISGKPKVLNEEWKFTWEPGSMRVTDREVMILIAAMEGYYDKDVIEKTLNVIKGDTENPITDNTYTSNINRKVMENIVGLFSETEEDFDTLKDVMDSHHTNVSTVAMERALQERIQMLKHRGAKLYSKNANDLVSYLLRNHLLKIQDLAIAISQSGLVHDKHKLLLKDADINLTFLENLKKGLGDKHPSAISTIKNIEKDWFVRPGETVDDMLLNITDYIVENKDNIKLNIRKDGTVSSVDSWSILSNLQIDDNDSPDSKWEKGNTDNITIGELLDKMEDDNPLKNSLTEGIGYISEDESLKLNDDPERLEQYRADYVLSESEFTELSEEQRELRRANKEDITARPEPELDTPRASNPGLLYDDLNRRILSSEVDVWDDDAEWLVERQHADTDTIALVEPNFNDYSLSNDWINPIQPISSELPSNELWARDIEYTYGNFINMFQQGSDVGYRGFQGMGKDISDYFRHKFISNLNRLIETSDNISIVRGGEKILAVDIDITPVVSHEFPFSNTDFIEIGIIGYDPKYNKTFHDYINVKVDISGHDGVVISETAYTSNRINPALSEDTGPMHLIRHAEPLSRDANLGVMVENAVGSLVISMEEIEKEKIKDANSGDTPKGVRFIEDFTPGIDVDAAGLPFSTVDNRVFMMGKVAKRMNLFKSSAPNPDVVPLMSTNINNDFPPKVISGEEMEMVLLHSEYSRDANAEQIGVRERIEEARSTTHTIGTFWEKVVYDTTVRDSALFLLGNTGLQQDNVQQLIQNLEDFAETNNAIVELNLTATAHNLNTDNIRTIEIRPSGITNSQSSMIYANSVAEGNNVFIGRIDIAAPSNSFGENFDASFKRALNIKLADGSLMDLTRAGELPKSEVQALTNQSHPHNNIHNQMSGGPFATTIDNPFANQYNINRNAGLGEATGGVTETQYKNSPVETIPSKKVLRQLWRAMADTPVGKTLGLAWKAVDIGEVAISKAFEVSQAAAIRRALAQGASKAAALAAAKPWMFMSQLWIAYEVSNLIVGMAQQVPDIANIIKHRNDVLKNGEPWEKAAVEDKLWKSIGKELWEGLTVAAQRSPAEKLADVIWQPAFGAIENYMNGDNRQLANIPQTKVEDTADDIYNNVSYSPEKKMDLMADRIDYDTLFYGYLNNDPQANVVVDRTFELANSVYNR